MPGEEAAPRSALIEQSVRNLVTEIGHGKAVLTPEQGGALRIENTEGQGILGLGCDSSGKIWLCPSQDEKSFNRNKGWNANSLYDLDRLDPETMKVLQIEVIKLNDGKTAYRFQKGHWLTKFYHSMKEAGVKELGCILHVAQKPDWADHKAFGLELDETDGALVATGLFPRTGEMKLSIKGLGVKEWSDGNWVPGAKQEMLISPS